MNTHMDMDIDMEMDMAMSMNTNENIDIITNMPREGGKCEVRHSRRSKRPQIHIHTRCTPHMLDTRHQTPQPTYKRQPFNSLDMSGDHCLGLKTCSVTHDR